MAPIPSTGISLPSQDLYDLGSLTDSEINREIATLDTVIMAASGDPDKTTRLETLRRTLRDEQDRRGKTPSEHRPDGTGQPFPEVEHPPHH
jgi:hypothetical protein